MQPSVFIAEGSRPPVGDKDKSEHIMRIGCTKVGKQPVRIFCTLFSAGSGQEKVGALTERPKTRIPMSRASCVSRNDKKDGGAVCGRSMIAPTYPNGSRRLELHFPSRKNITL